MEGKTVVLSVLMISLVMAQIQVEAKVCCPTQVHADVYNTCTAYKHSREYCEKLSRCQIISGTKCSPCSPIDYDENSGDSVNEYCTMECASCLCGASNTRKISVDASEIVNGALKDCTKACSTHCTKDFNTALDQIA